MGERQFETYVKSTVINLNTYLQDLPSHHQYRGYVQIFMYVFKILKQTIVEQFEVEIITLREDKTQEQVLKLFSACVVIAEIDFFQLNPGYLHRGCLFYESNESMSLSQMHFTL